MEAPPAPAPELLTVPVLTTLVDEIATGGKGAHFTTPMMQLQDPKPTKVLLATLAETTPVLKAANLQDNLRRAGIEPWAWIINNSIAAAHTYAPLLLQRTANERKGIDTVAAVHAERYAVVPPLSIEPVRQQALRALSDSSEATPQRKLG